MNVTHSKSGSQPLGRYQDTLQQAPAFLAGGAYLKVLPDLVKELADETCAAKGVKLEQFQRAPILDELYKRVPPKSPPTV